MKEEIREIEVITTVEITHIMKEDDLEALGNDIPETPEEMEEWKKGIAESFSGEIMNALIADHVSVANVQIFMKDDEEVPACAEESEA